MSDFNSQSPISTFISNSIVLLRSTVYNSLNTCYTNVKVQFFLIFPLLQSLSDPRFELILEKISRVINDETQYQKGALNMRTLKCFAVKVRTGSFILFSCYFLIVTHHSAT